jgi:hypothetical protein
MRKKASLQANPCKEEGCSSQEEMEDLEHNGESTNHENVEGRNFAAPSQRCLLRIPVRYSPASRRHAIRDRRNLPAASSVSRERVCAATVVRGSKTKSGGGANHDGSIIRKSPQPSPRCHHQQLGLRVPSTTEVVASSFLFFLPHKVSIHTATATAT